MVPASPGCPGKEAVKRMSLSAIIDRLTRRAMVACSCNRNVVCGPRIDVITAAADTVIGDESEAIEAETVGPRGRDAVLPPRLHRGTAAQLTVLTLESRVYRRRWLYQIQIGHVCRTPISQHCRITRMRDKRPF